MNITESQYKMVEQFNIRHIFSTVINLEHECLSAAETERKSVIDFSHSKEKIARSGFVNAESNARTRDVATKTFYLMCVKFTLKSTRMY